MANDLRICFWGNFGTGNWGNECTLQAIIHNTRRCIAGADLICVCSEPGDTEQRHGINAFPINAARARMARGQPPEPRRILPLRLLRRLSFECGEWFAALKVAATTDIVVMTGTGMLTDMSEGALGLPYDILKWALATKVCRKKLAFVSVGVEPIEHPATRLFIRAALRLADYRSYRDRHSQEGLTQAGFAAERDSILPDLAFSLPEVAQSNRRLDNGKKGKVAVGLYDYRSRGQSGNGDLAAYHAYLEKVGSFVAWLVEQNYLVRIIIGDATYDTPVLEDFRNWLTANNLNQHGAIEDEPAGSVDEIIRQIADVDIVVASRFHNVLLGLFLGKPALSVSYEKKNDALMAAMGLDRYCQSLDEFDVDRLIEQFGDLERNADQLRAVIANRAERYRADLEVQYQSLFGPEGLVRRDTPSVR